MFILKSIEKVELKENFLVVNGKELNFGELTEDDKEVLSTMISKGAKYLPLLYLNNKYMLESVDGKRLNKIEYLSYLLECKRIKKVGVKESNTKIRPLTNIENLEILEGDNSIYFGKEGRLYEESFYKFRSLKDMADAFGKEIVRYDKVLNTDTGIENVFDFSQNHGGAADSFQYYNDYVLVDKRKLEESYEEDRKYRMDYDDDLIIIRKNDEVIDKGMVDDLKDGWNNFEDFRFDNETKKYIFNDGEDTYTVEKIIVESTLNEIDDIDPYTYAQDVALKKEVKNDLDNLTIKYARLFDEMCKYNSIAKSIYSGFDEGKAESKLSKEDYAKYKDNLDKYNKLRKELRKVYDKIEGLPDKLLTEDEEPENITYLLDRWDWNVSPITEEELGMDYSYHKLLKSIHDAEMFNYHSDYWGNADDYQRDAIEVVSDFEPYVDKMVKIDFDDGTSEVFKLLGVLVDKQYNSLSHMKLLVEEVNNLKEDSYPNFDLPEGYPQEVYDKYFEYTKNFDLVEEEPLDFNDWYNSVHVEARVDESKKMVLDSYNHLVNDLGKEPTLDDILDDILHSYSNSHDYFKGEESPEEWNNDIKYIQWVLRRENLNYQEDLNEEAGTQVGDIAPKEDYIEPMVKVDKKKKVVKEEEDPILDHFADLYYQHETEDNNHEWSKEDIENWIKDEIELGNEDIKLDDETVDLLYKFQHELYKLDKEEAELDKLEESLEDSNVVQKKTAKLLDGTEVKFITYKNDDGTYNLQVMSNYENCDEYCGEFKELTDLDRYIEKLINSGAEDDEKLYYVNYIKESVNNKVEIEYVEPNYSGGGIYLYTGKLKDGNYFLGSDETFYEETPHFMLRVVDEDPNKYEEDCWFDDWQQEHLVKDLTEEENKEMTKQILHWVVDNKPDGNYQMADIKNMLDKIGPKNIEESFNEEIDGTKQRFIDYCKGKIESLGSVEINSEDVEGITYIPEDEEPKTFEIKVDYISRDDVKALNPVDTLEAFELENTYLYPDGRVFDGGEMDAGHIAHLAELDFKAIDKEFYQEVLDNWENWELPSWFEVADEHRK